MPTCNGGAQPDGAHPGSRAVADAVVVVASPAEGAALARSVEGYDAISLPRLSRSAAAQRRPRADAQKPSATAAHVGAEQGWGPAAPAVAVGAGPPLAATASAQSQPVSLTVQWHTPAAAAAGGASSGAASAAGGAQALLLPEMGAEVEDPSAGADGALHFGRLQANSLFWNLLQRICVSS